MFSSPQDFFTASAPFIQIFDAWASRMTPDATADHICYKCESSEEFESMRKMFESSSVFIYQSIISQRRIAIVKFLEPIQTSLGPIWFLELSDQKPDGSQKSEFDHIEIYPNTGTMDDLAIAINKTFSAEASSGARDSNVSRRTDMYGEEHLDIRKPEMAQIKTFYFEKIIRPHHTTYDAFLEGTFKVRLEPDALIGKIKREEML